MAPEDTTHSDTEEHSYIMDRNHIVRREKSSGKENDSRNRASNVATHPGFHGFVASWWAPTRVLERIKSPWHMKMRLLLWVLSPFKTFLVLLHTFFCVIVGMMVILVRRTRGDWVMWHVGRNLWSRPMLQFILGAKVEIEVHSDVTSSLQDRKGMVLIANHMSLLDINAAFCGSPARDT